MKVREENRRQIVLELTPWGAWIVPCVIGPIFVAAAIWTPFEFPNWARAIFFTLGVMVPIGFLANHAAIRAVFSRTAGNVVITRKRPIGGTSRTVIPLKRIARIDQITDVDVDNTSFNRIELVLRTIGSGFEREALTTGPISNDHADAAARLAQWLRVPLEHQRNA